MVGLEFCAGLAPEARLGTCPLREDRQGGLLLFGAVLHHPRIPGI